MNVDFCYCWFFFNHPHKLFHKPYKYIRKIKHVELGRQFNINFLLKKESMNVFLNTSLKPQVKQCKDIKVSIIPKGHAVAKETFLSNTILSDKSFLSPMLSNPASLLLAAIQ